MALLGVSERFCFGYVLPAAVRTRLQRWKLNLLEVVIDGETGDRGRKLFVGAGEAIHVFDLPERGSSESAAVPSELDTVPWDQFMPGGVVRARRRPSLSSQSDDDQSDYWPSDTDDNLLQLYSLRESPAADVGTPGVRLPQGNPTVTPLCLQRARAVLEVSQDVMDRSLSNSREIVRDSESPGELRPDARGVHGHRPALYDPSATASAVPDFFSVPPTNLNQIKRGVLGHEEVIIGVWDSGHVVAFSSVEPHAEVSQLFNSAEETWGLDVDRGGIVVSANSHRGTLWNVSTESQGEAGEGYREPLVFDPPQSLVGHEHNMPCVSFSPCGQFVASASIDGTARVWGRHSGEELCALTFPEADWVWAVCFIPTSEVEEVELSAGEMAMSGGVDDAEESPEPARAFPGDSAEYYLCVTTFHDCYLFALELNSQSETSFCPLLCGQANSAILYSAMGPLRPMSRCSILMWIRDLSAIVVGNQGSRAAQVIKIVRKPSTGILGLFLSCTVPRMPPPCVLAGLSVHATPDGSVELFTLFENGTLFSHELFAAPFDESQAWEAKRRGGFDRLPRAPLS